MSGRDWTPLKEIMLVDTAVELKDNHRLARRYKGQAEHLQALVDAGVEYTVNF